MLVYKRIEAHLLKFTSVNTKTYLYAYTICLSMSSYFKNKNPKNLTIRCQKIIRSHSSLSYNTLGCNSYEEVIVNEDWKWVPKHSNWERQQTAHVMFSSESKFVFHPVSRRLRMYLDNFWAKKPYLKHP